MFLTATLHLSISEDASQIIVSPDLLQAIVRFPLTGGNKDCYAHGLPRLAASILFNHSAILLADGWPNRGGAIRMPTANIWSGYPDPHGGKRRAGTRTRIR